MLFILISCNSKALQNKITIIFFKHRDATHTASELQDALISSEAIQTIDIATEITNGVHSITENETQTDMFNVRNKCEKYILIIIHI